MYIPITKTEEKCTGQLSYGFNIQDKLEGCTHEKKPKLASLGRTVPKPSAASLARTVLKPSHAIDLLPSWL